MVNTHTKDLPYIFISYSHDDEEKVSQIIQYMSRSGYHVWSDKEIEGGDDWQSTIAESIKNCAVFLLFLSGSFVDSPYCLDELSFAKKYEKVMLPIFIENNTSLPPAVEIQISRFQYLCRCDYSSSDALAEAICEQRILISCKQKTQKRADAPPHPVQKPSGKTGPSTPKKEAGKQSSSGSGRMTEIDRLLAELEKSVERQNNSAISDKKSAERGYNISENVGFYTELTYGFLAPFVMAYAVEFFGGILPRLGIMLIPRAAVTLLSIIIYCFATRQSRRDGMLNCILTMIFSTILAIVGGVLTLGAIDDGTGFLMRVLIAVGLNVIPTILSFLAYSICS